MFELIFVIGIALIAYKFWPRGKTSFDTQPKMVVQTRVTGADDTLDAEGWNEPVDMVPSKPKSIKATLRLDYRDATGKTSERIVDVKECDTSNPAGYLIGFCHLRRAIRTFRIDRIERAVDAETGEIISALTNFAAQRYDESPIASLDKLLADSSDAVRALFYIGKADGRFTSKEKQILLDFCRATTMDDRITLKQVDDLCKLMEIPTKQAFKLICGRLEKMPHDHRAAVILATEQMIATERTISGDEAEALDYMKKRLGASDPVSEPLATEVV